MDVGALIRNIKHTMCVCPTWHDRLNQLLFLYSNSKTKDSSKYKLLIKFSYSPPLSDIQLVVRRNRGADAFIISEVFDHRYYDFPLPFTPKTILDLGANAGFTSIFFARKYPDANIVAVEPVASNLEILHKNVELNNVAVDIVPAAVAIEDGYVSMDVSGLDYGHRVVDDPLQSTEKTKLTKVEAISVQSLMNRFQWERINLLKVDIEGYEKRLFTINCDWLNFVDAVCIECHEGFGKADLEELAQQYGFSKPQLLPGIWLLVRL